MLIEELYSFRLTDLGLHAIGYIKILDNPNVESNLLNIWDRTEQRFQVMQVCKIITREESVYRGALGLDGIFLNNRGRVRYIVSERN